MDFGQRVQTERVWCERCMAVLTVRLIMRARLSSPTAVRYGLSYEHEEASLRVLFDYATVLFAMRRIY